MKLKKRDPGSALTVILLTYLYIFCIYILWRRWEENLLFSKWLPSAQKDGNALHKINRMLPLQFILFWKKKCYSSCIKGTISPGKLNHLEEAFSIRAVKCTRGERNKHQGKQDILYVQTVHVMSSKCLEGSLAARLDLKRWNQNNVFSQFCSRCFSATSAALPSPLWVVCSPSGYTKNDIR